MAEVVGDPGGGPAGVGEGCISMRSRTLGGKGSRRKARSSSRVASSRWMRIMAELKESPVRVLSRSVL